MGRQSQATRAAQRSVKTISDDRKEAVEQMNAKLKRKLGTIDKMFADSREANLRFYHKLGSICREVKEDPETYDRKGYRLLEQALYTQKRTLRKARQFAELYDEAQLNGLIAMVHENTGYRIHWGHLTYLLGLNTEKQREDWAQKAVRNLWDPPALHAAIKKRFGDRGVGGGRPHQLPATTHMQIRQMMEVSRNFVNKRNLWNGDDENVFANVANEAPDEIVELDLDNLEATKAHLRTIATEARAMETQIDACIARVKDVFKQRAKAEKAAKKKESGAGKQLRSIDLGDGGQKGTTGSRRRRAPASAK